jgi:hypothetical protein
MTRVTDMPINLGRTLTYKEFAQVAGGSPAPGTVVVESGASFRRPVPPARLVCVHPPGPLLGRLYELRGVPVVVGRDDGTDLLVPDPSVSRTHARVDPRPDGVYEVTDLGSSNGTLVNGEAVGSRVVRCGDRIHFGNAVFLFLTGDGL